MHVDDKAESAIRANIGQSGRAPSLIGCWEKLQLKPYVTFLAFVACAAFGQNSSPCNPNLSSGAARVFSQIEAVRPAPQAPERYPMGNDLVLRAAGSADIHIATMPVVLQSTTAVAPGHAKFMVPSTAQLCPGTADCGIVVDPDTPREESVSPSNWRIDSPTQITATFALAHPAGFRIQQVGVVSFDTSRIVMNGADSRNHSVSLVDRNNNPFITMPNDTGSTWPNSALQFLGVITGNNGRGKDLVIRYNTPFSRVRFLNSGNTTQLLTMDNAGVTNFYGPDVYVHGTLHVASLKTDAPQSFGGDAQEMSVQSPDMMTVLSGIATMDTAGEAQVAVPSSFEKLNQDFHYQLTTIGSFAPVYVAREIQNNTFRIAGGKPGMRVSWQITGVRQK